MTKTLRLKKLTKDELRKLATLFKGQRPSLALEAGVSVQTVHNTFQDKHQNPKVIEAAYRIIKNNVETPTEIDALKKLLSVEE